ncbi:hypothetical protein BD560DRAFT_421725 [Blakeslea trispora]|nr:hypothetical protein BD560DRAFT_421725 [Blakeslea trispora]
MATVTKLKRSHHVHHVAVQVIKKEMIKLTFSYEKKKKRKEKCHIDHPSSVTWFLACYLNLTTSIIWTKVEQPCVISLGDTASSDDPGFSKSGLKSLEGSLSEADFQAVCIDLKVLYHNIINDGIINLLLDIRTSSDLVVTIQSSFKDVSFSLLQTRARFDQEGRTVSIFTSTVLMFDLKQHCLIDHY